MRAMNTMNMDENKISVAFCENFRRIFKTQKTRDNLYIYNLLLKRFLPISGFCSFRKPTDIPDKGIVTGSYSEGVGIPAYRKRGERKWIRSDIDRMFPNVLKFVCIDEPDSVNVHSLYERDNYTRTVLKLEDCYSGFCYLRRDDGQFQSWSSEPIEEDAKKLLVLADSKKNPVEIHGPSLRQISPSDMISPEMDHVLSIPITSWPKQASEFQKRKRCYDFPSERLIQDILDSCRCFVVAKYPEYIEETKGIWRLSFSLAERAILRNTLPVQRKALMLMKILRSSQFKIIPSYYMKTILLWTLECTPTVIWSEDTLYQTLNLLFENLIFCFQQKFLPNYFIPSSNLIHHLSDNEIDSTLQLLRAVNGNPLRFILDFDKQYEIVDVSFTCRIRFPLVKIYEDVIRQLKLDEKEKIETGTQDTHNKRSKGRMCDVLNESYNFKTIINSYWDNTMTFAVYNSRLRDAVNQMLIEYANYLQQEDFQYPKEKAVNDFVNRTDDICIHNVDNLEEKERSMLLALALFFLNFSSMNRMCLGDSRSHNEEVNDVINAVEISIPIFEQYKGNYMFKSLEYIDQISFLLFVSNFGMKYCDQKLKDRDYFLIIHWCQKLHNLHSCFPVFDRWDTEVHTTFHFFFMYLKCLYYVFNQNHKTAKTILTKILKLCTSEDYLTYKVFKLFAELFEIDVKVCLPEPARILVGNQNVISSLLLIGHLKVLLGDYQYGWKCYCLLYLQTYRYLTFSNISISAGFWMVWLMDRMKIFKLVMPNMHRAISM